MRVTTNKISEAEDALERAKESFLRQRGWSYTCDNASSTWLWQKALPDGRVILVCCDTAVNLQASADAISMKHWPKGAPPSTSART
jgi:hypothetical protein